MERSCVLFHFHVRRFGAHRFSFSTPLPVLASASLSHFQPIAPPHVILSPNCLFVYCLGRQSSPYLPNGCLDVTSRPFASHSLSSSSSDNNFLTFIFVQCFGSFFDLYGIRGVFRFRIPFVIQCGQCT